MIDHIQPKERLSYGRRNSDLWGFRPAHVTLFLIIALLVTLGFADRIDRWGEEPAMSFRVESSCGL